MAELVIDFVELLKTALRAFVGSLAFGRNFLSSNVSKISFISYTQ